MTTVNLGALILINTPDGNIIDTLPISGAGNGDVFLWNTLNSLSNIVSTFVIGIVNPEPLKIIDTIKEWSTGKEKTLIIMKEDKIIERYSDFGNKLLACALDLKNSNHLDYILYLTCGETLENTDTIPEILSKIHDTCITGIKLNIYTGDNVKSKLRLIKAIPNYKFYGDIEPELISEIQGCVGSVYQPKALSIRSLHKLNGYYYEEILDSVLRTESISSTLASNLILNKSDNGVRNFYYKWLITRDNKHLENIISFPNKPGEEEYLYEAYLELAQKNMLDYAHKAYTIKKRIEPLLLLSQYFMENKNYDFAFMYAKKMIDIEDTNNIYNRDYVRWKILAQIGLTTNNPEHFIYGKMGAIRMIYSTRDIASDTEILQEYKNKSEIVSKEWDIVNKFELSLRENLALFEAPKLAILHAVEDIKDIE